MSTLCIHANSSLLQTHVMHASFILYLFYLINVQKVNMSDKKENSCQIFEDKLKEGIQRLLIDGVIAEILQAQIKAATVLTRNS